jgi:hypothetical protein
MYNSFAEPFYGRKQLLPLLARIALKTLQFQSAVGAYFFPFSRFWAFQEIRWKGVRRHQINR